MFWNKPRPKDYLLLSLKMYCFIYLNCHFFFIGQTQLSRILTTNIKYVTNTPKSSTDALMRYLNINFAELGNCG